MLLLQGFFFFFFKLLVAERIYTLGLIFTEVHLFWYWFSCRSQKCFGFVLFITRKSGAGSWEISAGTFSQSVLYKDSLYCLLILIFSVNLIYFLSLHKDPKGDGSWMFPLRLSACFQKRVWQESSECSFLILLFILYSNFLNLRNFFSLFCSVSYVVLEHAVG